jgi:hypothetical protein
LSPRGRDQSGWIDEIRVFYDVKETTVEILAILQKADGQRWLDKEASQDTGGPSGEG